jgi:hypothetical protein
LAVLGHSGGFSTLRLGACQRKNRKNDVFSRFSTDKRLLFTDKRRLSVDERRLPTSKRRLTTDKPGLFADERRLTTDKCAALINEARLQHDTPSATYVTNAQRVVRERVALAGYRLADLLNEIFK